MSLLCSEFLQWLPISHIVIVNLFTMTHNAVYNSNIKIVHSLTSFRCWIKCPIFVKSALAAMFKVVCSSSPFLTCLPSLILLILWTLFGIYYLLLIVCLLLEWGLAIVFCKCQTVNILGFVGQIVSDTTTQIPVSDATVQLHCCYTKAFTDDP